MNPTRVPYRALLSFVTAITLILAVAAPARAISAFSRQFGFACEKCHTIVPTLNAFGQGFKANGYRIAGRAPRGTFPVSATVSTVYRSDPGTEGLGRLVLDDVRLQSGGALGSALSFFVENYTVDGGKPGYMAEAWVQYDSNIAHPVDKAPVRVRVGQIYSPLPVYAETYRETLTPFAIFDQEVGENPFSFGAPHLGIEISAGQSYYGPEVHALLLDSHENGSLIARSAPDLMLYAADHYDAFSFHAYRLQGSRALVPASDRFWRQGFGAQIDAKKASFTAVVQNGNDSSATGRADAVRSSGWFTQGRWCFSVRLCGVARYDSALAGGQSIRGTTVSMSAQLWSGSRFTLERAEGAGHSVTAAALLFGF